MKVSLPISVNYVLHWTIFEALREIYQNSIDQSNLSKTDMINNYKDGTLVVGNYGVKLSKSTLVMGNSPKTDDDSQIGNFGEGYKLALVVLLRNKIKVEIMNNGEIWIPRLEYSEEFETKILTVEIKEVATDDTVKFLISGLRSSVYNSYTQYNLRLQDYKSIDVEDGQILLDERNRAKMFIEGLFICKMSEDFKYGYNFKAGIIPVDRDRMKLSSFDVKWKTSKMISQIDNDDMILKLIDERADDVIYIDSHLSDNTISDKLYDLFKSEYGNYLPVIDEYERSRLEKQYNGVKAKVIGSRRFNLLKLSEGYKSDHNNLEERHIDNPNEILIRFMDNYEDLFSSVLRKVFIDEIMTVSKEWKVK